jgi:ABC-type multidrug transport system fused ATPase/permease subunit
LSRQHPPSSLARWLGHLLIPYRHEVALLATISAAEVTLRVTAPWAMKAAVDHVFVADRAPRWLVSLAHLVSAQTRWESRVSMLVAIVALGMLAHLAHQLVLLAHTRAHARLAQRMTRDMREHLFWHLQRLTLAHHANRPPGDAVYRITSDAGWLDQIVLRAAIPSVFSALTLLVMFAVLVRINGLLAFVSLAVVPGLYLSLRLHNQRMRGEAERVKALESRVVERAQESFATIRLVKSFAREPYERVRFAGVSQSALTARLALSGREARFSFVVGALTAAGTSLVLGVGGALVIDGTITLGTLLLVLAYLGFIYGPLTALANTGAVLREAVAAARRVRDILSVTPEAFDAPAARRLATSSGAVRFENVSFAYAPGHPVVRHVSFTAAPGEFIAIVGPSGSGKTTLLSLLMRLFEPSHGRILIDGIDIATCSLRSVREHVAVVLQESILVSGSVRENLRYGRLDAVAAQIESAARAANAHEFILRLPHGYETDLGANGGRLSGGQRQRLSIARAFLKDAPVLILDEPTAALDTLSELQLVSAITRLRRSRTTFVIAHRLSTVRDADRIIVLDGGMVVDQGTHDELRRRCALYARLAGEFTDAEAGSQIAMRA